MGSLDDQFAQDAQERFDILSAEYLAIEPGADLETIIYTAIVDQGIFSNAQGIPFNRFSIFTKLKGLEAALSALVFQP